MANFPFGLDDIPNPSWTDGEEINAAKLEARITALLRLLVPQPTILTGAQTITTGALNTPVAGSAITFATAFANAPQVVLTVQNVGNPQNYHVSTSGSLPTTSGFQIELCQTAGALGAVTIHWIAIDDHK